MLNRTNRTLSANLNRLNLGTRSLVLKTSAINGKVTHQIRHAHGSAMRDGMSWSIDPSIQSMSRIAIPTIPGSSPVVPWPAGSLPVRPSVADSDVFRAIETRSFEACFAVAYRGRTETGRPGYKAGRQRSGQASGAARNRATGTTAAARFAAAVG